MDVPEMFQHYLPVHCSAIQEKLLEPVRSYLMFLYVGCMVVWMTSWLASEASAAAVPRLPASFDFPVTCATFVAATLLLQRKFARALERRPAAAPRLAPLAARMFAVIIWLFATGCFLSYLRFGKGYFLRRSYQWAAAGIASAANLAMATRSVMRYLA